MEFSKEEFAAHVKNLADNYPDLDDMVEKGELIYKSGWYEPTSQEAREKIGPYATQVRIRKNGKAQFKVMRSIKKIKAIADKL